MTTYVPQQLKNFRNFVVWKYEDRGKKNPDGTPKFDKVPYDAKNPRRMAKSNDSSTWATFEKASAVANDPLSGFDGIGFMLQGTNFVGVDFDGVIDDAGTVDPYVLSIIAQLGNPYTEITPSGTGMRCFVECDKLPEGKRKFSDGNHYGVEIYIGTEGGRYLTVTGNKYGGEGVPKVADLEIPYFLISQFRNTKLKKLWMGDASDFANDQSRADLALCDELVKLLGKDPMRVERYFNASALCDEKWTSRPEYREWTITKALDVKTASKESAYGVPPATVAERKRELQFHLPAVEKNGSHRDYVIAPAAGQKFGWFPSGGTPSVVAGSSGTGKTTWIDQLLTTQSYEKPFHDHGTYGYSHLTLGVDRGEADHLETMERMHLNPELVPFKPLSSVVFDFDAAQAILEQIEATVPMPKIVVVEGADMLVSKVSDIKEVSIFMHELQKISERYDIAFVLTTGSPKIKDGAGYSASRDNILGSSGWGRVASTVVHLQFTKNKRRRKLTVEPRNAAPEEFTCEFQDGQLVVVPDDEVGEEENDNAFAEIQWFKEQARRAGKDPEKKWWTALDFQRTFHLSHATAQRHLDDELTKNHIRIKHGKKKPHGAKQYCWNESETNPIWEQETQEQVDVF